MKLVEDFFDNIDYNDLKSEENDLSKFSYDYILFFQNLKQTNKIKYFLENTNLFDSYTIEETDNGIDVHFNVSKFKSLKKYWLWIKQLHKLCNGHLINIVTEKHEPVVYDVTYLNNKQPILKADALYDEFMKGNKEKDIAILYKTVYGITEFTKYYISAMTYTDYLYIDCDTIDEIRTGTINKVDYKNIGKYEMDEALKESDLRESFLYKCPSYVIKALNS